MAVGRRQKRSKKASMKTSRNSVEPIDKIRVTVQPDCFKVSQPKNAPLRVNLKRYTSKLGKGDGTEIVNFWRKDGKQEVEKHRINRKSRINE